MLWAPDLNSTLHTAAKNCTLKYPMNIHLVGEISISCFEKKTMQKFFKKYFEQTMHYNKLPNIEIVFALFARKNPQ